MSLRLVHAAPRQGAAWVARSFSLFLKRPFAFSSLFLAFLVGAMLLLALPYLGALLVLAALPLLTLGYMLATRAALADEPVHAGHLVAPLLPGADASRRRAMLVLCVAYAVVTAAVMLLADQLDGGGFERLQVLLASARTEANQRELDTLLADPRLWHGTLLRFGGSALLAIPFWHAPALVWWHGQGLAQSLFSSTLACWRNKGAFVVYTLAWAATVALFGAVASAVFALLGMPALVGLAAVPAMLMFSTAFYVSLYFTFVDSFADDDPAA
ncbi:MAG TPA: BPSS1780 family membrane protein [Burkholderiaceae bacterium]|nr:BPSS1780 family membrane protein [Burkholderiaceae bacterium]